jgi:hypothetical protein
MLIHIKFLWEQYNVSLYILDEILKNSQAQNLQNRIPIQIEFKSENRNRKRMKGRKNKGNTYQPEPTEPAQLPTSPVLIPVHHMTSRTHQEESLSSTSGSKKQLAVVLPSLGRAKIRAAAL